MVPPNYEALTSRTTLDVLDAAQELVDIRVSLAGARRDDVVAAYLILISIGIMTAHGLQLPVSVPILAYDPSQHIDATRDRLFGTDTDTVDCRITETGRALAMKLHLCVQHVRSPQRSPATVLVAGSV